MPQFDATTAANIGHTGSTDTVSHTVTAGGNNRAIYVIITQWAASGSDGNVTGVTYAGSACTKVADSGQSSGNDWVTIWRRLAPSTGANNVVVTYAGSTGNRAGRITIISFTGVNQTTPEGTASTATGNSTAPTSTLTCVNGDYAIDGVAWDNSATATASMTAGNGRTQLSNAIPDGEGGAASRHSCPATSQAMAWTLTTTDTWAHAAIQVKPDNLPSLWEVGASQASAAGNLTVAWPTHQADDIALLLIESTGGQAANLTTANGFAAVTNSPQSTGAGTAGTRLTMYWCRATGSSMSSPVVTAPGNHGYARIITFRGCITSGDPWNITGGGTKGSASTTTTIAAVTTTVNNCLVVLAASRDNDSAAAAWSNPADASLADLVERADEGTALGNGGGIGVWTGYLASAGSTGTFTATVTSSVDGDMVVALAPPATGGASIQITMHHYKTMAV